MIQKKIVVIVGGGAAGLSAAAYILENSKDIEVHLIEAQDKLGGRANTNLSIKDFPFDMGPLYVQDFQENPWTSIGDALGMKFVLQPEDSRSILRLLQEKEWVEQDSWKVSKFNQEKKLIDESIEKNSKKTNVTAFDKPARAEKFDDFQYQVLAQSIESPGPVAESGELWQINVAEHLRADKFEECPDEELLEKVDKKLIKKLSDEETGTNIFAVSGIGTLIATYGEKLQKAHEGRFYVYLKTPVTKIKHSSSGVEVFYTHEGSKSIKADVCIVTASTNVIINNVIDFEPKLSKELMLAFSLLPLGSYKKLAFALKQDIKVIEPANDHYLAHQSKGIEGVWQYFRLPHHPKFLMVHTFGDFAFKLDQLDDKDVYKLFLDDLAKAYPEIKLADFIDFDTCAITNWTKNPFVLGAYSYTTVLLDAKEDDDTALKARETISKPVNGRLFFAGEANNIAKYATISGARAEGRRVAKAAVKLLQ